MNTRAHLPDPATAPDLFDGVVQRRMMAFAVDAALLLAVSGVLLLVGVIAGLFTFGVAWLALPVVLPVAILAYYAATLGSSMRATPGMAMMDIVLVPTNGYPRDGWKALIHPLAFWITIWISWPISLLVLLFTPRRQTIADLISGTLMLRRSPMQQHWSARRARA